MSRRKRLGTDGEWVQPGHEAVPDEPTYPPWQEPGNRNDSSFHFGPRNLGEDVKEGDKIRLPSRTQGAKRRRDQDMLQNPTTDPTRGPLRAVPCEGCIRMAIARKSNWGRCFESEDSEGRCFACKGSDRECRPCHPAMVPIARRMLAALDVDEKMYGRCKNMMAFQFDLLEEENPVYANDADGTTGVSSALIQEGAEARRLRAKQLCNELIGLVR